MSPYVAEVSVIRRGPIRYNGKTIMTQYWPHEYHVQLVWHWIKVINPPTRYKHIYTWTQTVIAKKELSYLGERSKLSILKQLKSNLYIYIVDSHCRLLSCWLVFIVRGYVLYTIVTINLQRVFSEVVFIPKLAQAVFLTSLSLGLISHFLAMSSTNPLLGVYKIHYQ